MGIYISGVKGLPEQVQENKEKIANIEEDIADIDWDAIHNLENQVAENTQDINNMEGTIGTQNIAITQLGGRVDDLEDKTQDIERQGSMLYIDTGSVVLNAGLGFEADSGADIKLNPDDIGYRPNKICSSANSNLNMYFNDSGLIINSNGGEYEFINDTINVNGTPIGTTLYQHRILLAQSSNTYAYYNIFFDIISTRSTEYTKNDLWTYLSTNLVNANISATGYHGIQIPPATDNMVYSIIHNGTSIQVKRFKVESTFVFSLTTANISSTAYNHSSTTITDTVIAL